MFMLMLEFQVDIFSSCTWGMNPDKAYTLNHLQAGGSGWSAGLGSNLGWALSSFGASKAKGQPVPPAYFTCIALMYHTHGPEFGSGHNP